MHGPDPGGVARSLPRATQDVPHSAFYKSALHSFGEESEKEFRTIYCKEQEELMLLESADGNIMSVLINGRLINYLWARWNSKST